ncbi:L-aminopeptidase/D-esterase-like protein [Xenorhabdus cabanillasii]|uniref:L-aminopeptidase/D-esterase-like protein n=1 Tax=Xenorhabdus cabanillasii TaxID=351673 RepID=A0A3D9UU27_9GAMM|nr:P1 family peptidase [Xenorhabdus cabanillasii]REF28221.1 L-aminopeptidase/D-esterase-like protein [Xenorhabdus cabanillasii]
MNSMKILNILILSISIMISSNSLANEVRARDFGIPFSGTTGKYNAITDVNGVKVGYSTIIEGNGKLEVGKGPIRTGVTAILPRGKNFNPVFSGIFSLNGNGEMTGSQWVQESGFLETPILITNTHSVGVVRDSTISWMIDNNLISPLKDDLFWLLPVVTETWDGILNDINGMHVKKEHVYHALNSAKSGVIKEGNVGGGTGMNLFNFKGGTGTSSRILDKKDGGYTVGVLVQGNFGFRDDLIISGIQIGKEIQDITPIYYGDKKKIKDAGSIIAVVATDAPLAPHQLEKIAKRVSLGLAKVGGVARNTSGEIFIAFSTANNSTFSREDIKTVEILPNDKLDPLYEATINATEEAIINAMFAAKTMVGRNGNTSYAIPKDRVREILKKYNLLSRI